jgi:hypothetical protein
LTANSQLDRLSSVRAIERYASRECAADQECVAQLEERFSVETDVAVQRALVDCFARVGGAGAAHTLVVNAVNRQLLAPSVGAHALGLVASRLTRDDFDAVVSAATASSWADNDVLLSAAMDALSHAPDEVFADRVNAHRSHTGRVAVLLSAIARRGDPRWGAVVIEQLGGDIALRIAAANAAASLRLLEAATPLARLVLTSTEPPVVRNAALRALAVVGAGDPAMTERAIVQGLGVTTTTESAQVAAARLGMQSVVPMFAPLLRASWAVDRRTAAERLGDLGGVSAARLLLTALQTEQDQSVRRVLWRSAIIADPTAAEAALRVSHDDSAALWGAVELGVRTGKWISLSATHTPHARSTPELVLECARGLTSDALTRLRDGAVQERVNAGWALTFAPPNNAVERVILQQITSERDPIVRALLWIVAGRNDSLAVRTRLAENFVGQPSALTADVLVSLFVASRLGVRFSTAWTAELLADQRPSVRAIGAWAIRWLSLQSSASQLERVADTETNELARRAEMAALGRREFDSTQQGLWHAHESEFRGAATLRVEGATGSSLWVCWLPGGAITLAIADGSGVLLLPDAPSGPMVVDRIE